jgi:hypothetical protein
MLGEAIAVTAIGATVVTILDHENIFGQNPLKQFWWERIFPQPAAARIIRPTLITQISGEQRIKQAQATMGEMQREIARGVEQQTQEARQVQSRQSKYVITDTSVPATKFEPYRK